LPPRCSWPILDDEKSPVKPAQAQRLPRQEPEALDDETRVVNAIEEGLADIQAGRVVDDEELDEVLRARLGVLID
jgi:predicted transcriptional regulator